ncbi:relaxase/mobilization nuclease domain-containing protein [Mucilaginibacter sp. BJC16-A38]|uniref:relaxase/mobilization nuclease domain-containing protein n=1 Tax=Mucilaginibacter phenanthrenivorans TaxID=1234842 RepID=UPI0021585C9F|nr:relaxase/mobilization nuclease domain-containing protein [Mucilaginibacter phenanthrenivorans]MCR8560481.1 relaxase/mobilization nuclease domain-containing protein [Mucilaginibacter phenanthrenivorans]
MIGKIPKPGKSFKGCIEYNLLKKDATILMADGIRIDSIAHTINDFNMQRKMNPGLGQAVGHMILSWSINDDPKLNDDVMVSIAKEYLQKMKIKDTQLLVVRHQDKEHPHLHIIYNRVDNNGKTISDNFQHLKNVKIAKELTLKHGFYIASDKKMVNRQQLKGTDKTKYDLFDAITAITKQVKSIDELKRQLLNKGIEMQFKYKSGTKEVQGVSFSKGDAKFKGSEIDRSLSYGRICKTIDQNIQHERTEQARHLHFVSELKNVVLSHTLTDQQNFGTGGKSLFEVLLEPDYVEPMPYVNDTDERKKKRRKSPNESYKISR